ncbi:MAG: TerD family protein [Micavibrio sp.]
MQDNEDEFEDPHPSAMMEDNPMMVRVRRGEEINITRLDPTIREVTIGVGWDLARFEGDPVDIDASLLLLDRDDMTREDEDFVFYNNMTARDGAVKHLGDSRTGAGDGDDEQIIIDLMALPFEIVKIAFILSIYDLDMNSNNFSMVRNVYFRIVNNETTLETFRFELDGELGNTTGLYIGYLERVGSDWVYKALGESLQGGLAKMASDSGIMIVENMRSG